MTQLPSGRILFKFDRAVTAWHSPMFAWVITVILFFGIVRALTLFVFSESDFLLIEREAFGVFVFSH